jgi:hypothetical protein
MTTQDYRLKYPDAILLSDEYKKRLSDRSSGERNPMFGSHRSGELNPFHGKHHSQSSKDKISAKNSGEKLDHWMRDPEKRDKHWTNPFIGRSWSEPVLAGSLANLRASVSASVSGDRNPFYGKHHTDETKSILSKKTAEQMKHMWSDPELRPKMLRSVLKNSSKRFARPNLSEIRVLNLLNFMYPDKWVYVGDGSFIVAGKAPDFINHESKQIIEFFGEAWHKPEEELSRSNIFEGAGYSTMIIWGNELYDLAFVIFKLKRFCEGGSNGFSMSV